MLPWRRPREAPPHTHLKGASLPGTLLSAPELPHQPRDRALFKARLPLCRQRAQGPRSNGKNGWNGSKSLTVKAMTSASHRLAPQNDGSLETSVYRSDGNLTPDPHFCQPARQGAAQSEPTTPLLRIRGHSLVREVKTEEPSLRSIQRQPEANNGALSSPHIALEDPRLASRSGLT